MFFFLPIGFGGGFFGFLFLILIIRLIFRILFSRTSTNYYYSFDSDDYNRFYSQANNQNQNNKDWYSVLGVSSQASDDEIKKAYRKLILMYHPDRVATQDEKQKEEATKKFREVQEAYENISKQRGIN